MPVFEAQPLHLLVERRAVDAELVGRRVAVPAVRFEHVENDLPLRAFEGFLERPLTAAELITHVRSRRGFRRGRSASVISGSLPSSTARSTTFCSSRTLPGQR